MDRSIEEIIVYWRKALAGGYYDSRLNASETGKLISEIERLRNGIQLALNKFAKRHRESGLEILQEALKEK